MEVAGFLALGILVGLLGALLGIGGGMVIVPLLVFAWDYEPQLAIGTSVLVVLMNAVSGTWGYVRQKKVCVDAALKFAVATVPGAFLGSYAAEYLQGRLFYLVFGAFFVLAAINMYRKANKEAAGKTAGVVPEVYNWKLGVLCSVGRQILLQPVHRVVDGLDGGCVSLLAGRLGVHLEQAPRVAVHSNDVQTGVIEGAVALDLCAVFFILNGVYIGVEVYTALIVVAGGIDNRIGVDVVVLHLALEPEAELLCLCAGAFYKVAAVQQQVGVKFLDGLIEFCAGRKNVRVRQGDQTDLIRFFAQGLEAGLAGRAALELYLVVVAGTGGQVVQLVVEQVHLAALEVGCVCVDLHLDRVTELALVGAVCDGRGDLLRAFPYDDHAVGLWCQKVGAVLELCAAVSRKCSRRHGHDHNSCDHSRA